MEDRFPEILKALGQADLDDLNSQIEKLFEEADAMTSCSLNSDTGKYKVDKEEFEESESLNQEYCQTRLDEMSQWFELWNKLQMVKHWDHLLEKTLKLLAQVITAEKDRAEGSQGMMLLNLKKKFSSSLKSLLMNFAEVPQGKFGLGFIQLGDSGESDWEKTITGYVTELKTWFEDTLAALESDELEAK